MPWVHRSHSPFCWAGEYRQRIEYLRLPAANCFFQVESRLSRRPGPQVRDGELRRGKIKNRQRLFLPSERCRFDRRTAVKLLSCISGVLVVADSSPGDHPDQCCLTSSSWRFSS
jgi:hypothetical protein